MGCEYSKTSPAIIQTESLPSVYVSGKNKVIIQRSESINNALKEPYIIRMKKEVPVHVTIKRAVLKEPPTSPLFMERFYVKRKDVMPRGIGSTAACKILDRTTNVYLKKKASTSQRPTLSFLTRRLSAIEATTSGALQKAAEHLKANHVQETPDNKPKIEFMSKRKQSLTMTGSKAKASFTGQTLSHNSLRLANSASILQKIRPKLDLNLMIKSSINPPISVFSRNVLSQTSILAAPVGLKFDRNYWIPQKGAIKEIEKDSNDSICIASAANLPPIKIDPSLKVLFSGNACTPPIMSDEKDIDCLRLKSPEELSKHIRSLEITEILRKKFMSRLFIQTEKIMQNHHPRSKKPSRQSCSSISSSESCESPVPVSDAKQRRKSIRSG